MSTNSMFFLNLANGLTNHFPDNSICKSCIKECQLLKQQAIMKIVTIMMTRTIGLPVEY